MAVKEILMTKGGCTGYPAAQLVKGDRNTCLLRLIVQAEQGG